MDPTSNLSEQLDLAAEINALNDLDRYDAVQTRLKIAEKADRLAELVIALNGWIKGGGFLPDQMEVEVNTRYFVEFDTTTGPIATFHGFYDSAQAAMDAGHRTLIIGTRFRVIAFEPRVAATCNSGMRGKCGFCGDAHMLDIDNHCGSCLAGMSRTKGD